ncbi:MAG: SNF2-related protein [Xenococcaceae cyanobacterium]
MSILHGSWILQSDRDRLFIWGESWRSLVAVESNTNTEGIPIHPFCLSQAELISLLQNNDLSLEKFFSSEIDNQARWVEQIIRIPSRQEGKKKPLQPIYSAKYAEEEIDRFEYADWCVTGFYLTATETAKFLSALPLNALPDKNDSQGAELSFWTHIYRWILDLIARKKFLPGINVKSDSQAYGIWQPLLDSQIDLTRLAKFSQLMPPACLAYQQQALQPQELLLQFLGTIVDAQIRLWLDNNSITIKAITIQPWLSSLSEFNSLLETETKNSERLKTALDNWTLPIQEYLVDKQNNNLGKNQYRACFLLETPPKSANNKEQSDWQLKYYLQALDDLEFIIDAATIWQHPGEELIHRSRTIVNPQETLLKGLGLATRIYAPIATSLEDIQPTECQLNPIQVYEFIRSIAWQLQDNGLGVKFPPGLAVGEGEQRLGIKITAEVRQKKKERLNLQSLLQYNLEVAVGNSTVSKQEFKRLLDQKSPIVEVDGQWLVLQPADVKAAQAVLDKSNEQMNLSVEDALRLSTGNTNVLAKLPVVSFQATGVLQELINNLTDNKSVQPIEDIKGFRGELRPYQARGVGWLAFLEKWGLGACLADDMGLGKCVLPDTKIQINGILETAEQIWQNYSLSTIFDGEGYWSQTTKPLFVNSLDEVTGKVVKGKINNLYRQKISEKIKLIVLDDGSKIAITKKHKLLTINGWQNNFKIGEYVCVPSHLYYQGKVEDRELIEFLAWQIAEGYENNKKATLHISQKDPNILYRLKNLILIIGKRYSLKVNHPQVNIPNNGRVPYLTINSKIYLNFLSSRGYQWGKRSKDKSIPSFIMQANLDGVRVFLRNYFDAEGSVIISMRSIEISSASLVIIEQLSVLLRRWGIWLRIAKRQKQASNGSGIYRDYYIGTIGGNSARIFCEQIGFGCSDKQNKLERICQKPSNTNVEGIPASEIVTEVVANTQLPLRHLGMNNNVYVKGTQQFSNRSLSIVANSIDKIVSGKAEAEYRTLKLSKWTNKTLTAYKNLDITYLEQARQKLHLLLDREVFYCKIKSIEEIDYEGWVYDFEIEKYHNFVANNIICHNTIQTIGFLLNLKQQENTTNPTLLVCPTSVLNNWEREVHKFAPTLKTLIHHGDRRSKGKTFAKEVKDKQLVITSYSLVDRDLKTLEAINWEGVILDEAQNIKNSSAKQSQVVRKLPAGFRIALTGTPVENRLAELWSILDFLNPGFLGTRTFFQKRFAVPIEKYGDRDSLQTLRSLVQPFILRRLKTDKNIIQDLPEKQEMNVFCGLSTEQAEIYQQLAENSLQEIEDSEGIKRRGLILTLLLRLKQLCNHPELIKSKKVAENNSNFARRSGKLLRLEEMLEEIIAEDDRALIFTQFSEWGKLLQPYLQQKFKSDVIFLYGATRRQQRQEMIDRFQNDPNGPQIFILSLKAGGTGLNLTRANHVFHVDRWWNPAVENQATDRAFRIGQKRNVQVHKFVCTGTLEEKINAIIESKKELAEQTVDAGEQWLTDLDTAQLRNLLLLDRDAIIDT